MPSLRIRQLISYLRAKRYKKWRIVAVLLVTLVLASRAVVWLVIEQTNLSAAKQNFDAAISRRIDELQNQFEVYADTLYAGRALFLTNNTVTRQDWNTFIEAQKLSDRYPAVYGVAYISVINRSEVGRLTAQLNTSRLPNETTPIIIHPLTTSDTLAVLTYAAPSSIPQVGIGTNVLADPNRAQALAVARDTGLPQVSKPLRLTVDPVDTPPSVLVVLPVYASSATSLRTTTERQTAIQGYVVLALRTKPLLDNVFLASTNTDLSVSVSEGGTTVYSHGPTLTGETLKKHVELKIAGKMWSLDFTARSSYGLPTTARIAPTILSLSVVPFIITVGLILYFATRVYNPEMRKRLAVFELQQRQNQQNSQQ